MIFQDERTRMAKASGLEPSPGGDETYRTLSPASRAEDEPNPEHRQTESLEEEEEPLKDDRRNTLSFVVPVMVPTDPDAEEQTRTEFFTRDEFALAMAGNLEGTWEKLIQREHHWRIRDREIQQKVSQLETELENVRMHATDCEIERDEAIAHRDIAVNERNQQAYEMLQNQRMTPAQAARPPNQYQQRSVKLANPPTLTDGKSP